jgi:hypothetical protein
MEHRMRILLARAKRGDEDARRDVAMYVFDRYKGRLTSLYSKDPAVSMDDLLATFWEGIFRHVPKADGRGCDFYHIGQRGIWNVLSELRAVNMSMSHRQFPARTQVATDPVMELPDPDAEFVDVLVERVDAEDRVSVMTGITLKTRTQEALDLIRSGACGDPCETGFNQRLAGRMGVSPQRASQIMADLREALQ